MLLLAAAAVLLYKLIIIGRSDQTRPKIKPVGSYLLMFEPENKLSCGHKFKIQNTISNSSTSPFSLIFALKRDDKLRLTRSFFSFIQEIGTKRSLVSETQVYRRNCLRFSCSRKKKKRRVLCNPCREPCKHLPLLFKDRQRIFKRGNAIFQGSTHKKSLE